MTQQHFITLTPELVQQWIKQCDNPEEPRWQEYEQDIAARAALAQPEPVAPTDEELLQLLFDDHRSAIEFACDTEAEGDIVIDNHIDFAHAVLARWGTPANALPTPEAP